MYVVLYNHNIILLFIDLFKLVRLYDCINKHYIIILNKRLLNASTHDVSCNLIN